MHFVAGTTRLCRMAGAHGWRAAASWPPLPGFFGVGPDIFEDQNRVGGSLAPRALGSAQRWPRSPAFRLAAVQAAAKFERLEVGRVHVAAGIAGFHAQLRHRPGPSARIQRRSWRWQAELPFASGKPLVLAKAENGVAWPRGFDAPAVLDLSRWSRACETSSLRSRGAVTTRALILQSMWQAMPGVATKKRACESRAKKRLASD